MPSKSSSRNDPNKDALAGINTLLTHLKKNPGDTLITDRTLTLISEIADANHRYQMTLQMAEVILNDQPRLALELAFRTYQHIGETKNPPTPLNLVCQALEKLGRFGKAEVIRNELSKKKELKVTEPPTPLTIKKPQPPKSSEPDKMTSDAEDISPLLDLQIQLLSVGQNDARFEAFCGSGISLKKIDKEKKASPLPELKLPADHPLFEKSLQKEKITSTVYALWSDILKASFMPGADEWIEKLIPNEPVRFTQLQEWNLYLTSLLSAKQHAKCVRVIKESAPAQQKNDKQTQLQLLSISYETLLALWALLDMEGFQWDVCDGIDLFWKKMEKHPPMSLTELFSFT